jgi:hypothetical protein
MRRLGTRAGPVRVRRQSDGRRASAGWVRIARRPAGRRRWSRPGGGHAVLETLVRLQHPVLRQPHRQRSGVGVGNDLVVVAGTGRGRWPAPRARDPPARPAVARSGWHPRPSARPALVPRRRPPPGHGRAAGQPLVNLAGHHEHIAPVRGRSWSPASVRPGALVLADDRAPGGGIRLLFCQAAVLSGRCLDLVVRHRVPDPAARPGAWPPRGTNTMEQKG